MSALIPFVAGLNNIEIFLSTTTIFTTLRLDMTIKFLHILENKYKYKKAKQVANRLLWCLYNLMFDGLWFIDKCYAELDPAMEKYKKYIRSTIVAFLLVFKLLWRYSVPLQTGSFLWTLKLENPARTKSKTPMPNK